MRHTTRDPVYVRSIIWVIEDEVLRLKNDKGQRRGEVTPELAQQKRQGG